MASRYIEARRNDPDYARAVAEAELAALNDPDAHPDAAAAKWSPRPAEWTTEHELMAAFFDRLGDWLVQHANSLTPKGKPRVKPLPRFPRPVTAVDHARAEIDARVEDALDDLIAQAHATYEAENGGGA